MNISIYPNNSPYSTAEVSEIVHCEFDDLEKYVCNSSWSPSLFNNTENKKENNKMGMWRKKSNFKSCDYLALDIDDSCTIEAAKDKFKGYKAVFFTTRNHQKIKNKGKSNEKPACDRFRVIIPLEKTITNSNDYIQTWKFAENKWPFIDKACKDNSRFYFPSVKKVLTLNGSNFPVKNFIKNDNKKKTSQRYNKTQLHPSTLDFVQNGTEDGWHAVFAKAVSDFKRCGYSKAETIEEIEPCSYNFEGSLSKEDLDAIEYIYNRDEPYKYSDFQDDHNTWESPISFNLYETAIFDPNLFPEPLCSFIKEFSDYSETPPALSGFCTLGAVSASITGKFWTEPVPGHLESLNLYLMALLETGNRKTSALKAAVAPIEAWEKRQADHFGPLIQKAKVKRENEEAKIKAYRSGFKKGKDQLIAEAEVENLQLNLTNIPTIPRIIASDITPERMASIMFEQNEVLSIISDEGGFLDNISGRYNKGLANLDLFLKAYDGSTCRVDRQSKASTPILLKEPYLTTLICPQPFVLQSLSSKPEFRNKGAIGRFLYTLPDSKIGYRVGNKTPPSKTTKKNYEELISKLLEIKIPKNEIEKKERIISFDKDASKIMYQVSQDIERKMREGNSLYFIKDWGSKFSAKVARIAAIFELITNSEKTSMNLTVSSESMLRAEAFSHYLEKQALRTFNLIDADPNRENALYILNWIKKKELKQFTKRKCHNSLQTRFPKVAFLNPALQLLTDHNYIRRKEQDKVPHRPSDHFEVNPHLYNMETR